MTPEQKVQNKIIAYLKKLEKDGKPVFFQKRQAGGYNYKSGICDIYVVYRGTHIEIEVKRESGGALSPLQEKWRDKCQQKGITWKCFSSFEEFKIYMDELVATK